MAKLDRLTRSDPGARNSSHRGRRLGWTTRVCLGSARRAAPRTAADTRRPRTARPTVSLFVCGLSTETNSTPESRAAGLPDWPISTLSRNPSDVYLITASPAGGSSRSCSICSLVRSPRLSARRAHRRQLRGQLSDRCNYVCRSKPFVPLIEFINYGFYSNYCCPALCRERRAPMCRRGGGVILRPRGPRSCPSYAGLRRRSVSSCNRVIIRVGSRRSPCLVTIGPECDRLVL